MAKSNVERQAEHRARMRSEGKTALHVWVTPAQAVQVQALIYQVKPVLTAPLRIIEQPDKLLLVKNSGSLPPIPNNTPVSIVRELKEAQALHKKKLVQISKLQKDAAGIENWYRRTVRECNELK